MALMLGRVTIPCSACLRPKKWDYIRRQWIHIQTFRDLCFINETNDEDWMNPSHHIPDFTAAPR